ncbi:MAG: hypothetical protein ACNA78_03140 [Balneolaceae bacterium]
MRGFLTLFFTVWLVHLFLPWWAIALPVLLIAAWQFNSPSRSFWIGFLAGGSAWLVQALYIHIANQGILSGRIADMMGAGSPLVILLITFLIGGAITAAAALVGTLFKRTVMPPETNTA